MTSKSLFSKNGLLWESCRTRIWITVLAAAGFLLTSILPVAMTIQNFYEHNKLITKPISNTAHYTTSFNNAVQDVTRLLSNGNYFTAIGLILMAVIGGLGVFFYLHSRSETDFFHSLPISRGQLFAVNYLTTPVIVLPIYILCTILACIVAAASGFGAAVSGSIIAFCLLQNCLFFLLIYSVAVLTVILCGNRVISTLLLVWMYFSVPVLLLLWDSMSSQFFQTYMTPDGFESMVFNTSPVCAFFYLLDNGSSFFGMEHWQSQYIHFAAPTLGVCAAVFLAITLLCWALFRIRASESAGNTLAFPKLQLPIKLYMVFVVALAGGMLFQSIVNSSGILWYVVGILIGGVIMHCVAEGVYALDIRSIFHHVPQLILGLAIPLVVLAGFSMDVTGFDTKTVDLNQISGVYYESNSYDFSYYSSEETDRFLTDKDSIKAAWNIANLCVQNLPEDDASWNDPDHLRCTVVFRLKSGRTMTRYYSVNCAEALDLSNQFTYSQAYAEKNHILRCADLDDPDASLRIYSVYDNDEKYAAYIYDKAVIQQIFDTAWEEYRSVGLAYLQSHPPVAQMELIHSSGMVSIYPAYTKTLALIQANSTYQDIPHEAENVASIQLNFHTDIGDTYNTAAAQSAEANADSHYWLTATVTDPADIAALMKNSLLYQDVNQEYPLKNLSETIGIDENQLECYVTLKNGSSYFITYFAGQEPTATLQKYRALAKPDTVY